MIWVTTKNAQKKMDFLDHQRAPKTTDFPRHRFFKRVVLQISVPFFIFFSPRFEAVNFGPVRPVPCDLPFCIARWTNRRSPWTVFRLSSASGSRSDLCHDLHIWRSGTNILPAQKKSGSLSLPKKTKKNRSVFFYKKTTHLNLNNSFGGFLTRQKSHQKPPRQATW